MYLGLFSPTNPLGTNARLPTLALGSCDPFEPPSSLPRPSLPLFTWPFASLLAPASRSMPKTAA